MVLLPRIIPQVHILRNCKSCWRIFANYRPSSMFYKSGQQILPAINLREDEPVAGIFDISIAFFIVNVKSFIAWKPCQSFDSGPCRLSREVVNVMKGSIRYDSTDGTIFCSLRPKTTTMVTGLQNCKYRRILLKLSGEALMGNEKFGIDPIAIDGIANEIREAHLQGVQIAVVVGGGNIFRGVQGAQWGMDKAAADYVGMLATIMNALMLQEVLNHKNVETRVQTAIAMPEIAEPFIRLRAIRHLQKGRVVIFGGGTGNPLVTTDTAAALRAAEIKADALLVAKNKVDGVYDDDPRKNPNAKKYDNLSFDTVIKDSLKVMDAAAISLCQQNSVPIIVFDFAQGGSIEKIITGNKVGTIIGP